MHVLRRYLLMLASCFALIFCLGMGGDIWRPSGGGMLPDESMPTARRVPERMGRVEVAEVFMTVGDYEQIAILRAGVDGQEHTLPVRAGDRILAGDRIQVGAGVRLEFFMGLNARVLVKEDTSFVVLMQEVNVLKDMTVTRQHLHLEHGSLRVRVRKNIKTPEPISVHVGDAIVDIGNPGENVLGGTDGIVVASDKSVPSTVSILHGKATLHTQVMAGDGSKEFALLAAQRGVVPVKSGEAVSLQDISSHDLMELRRGMRFSTDRFVDEEPHFDYQHEAGSGP